jgi:hypothetical protein
VLIVEALNRNLIHDAEPFEVAGGVSRLDQGPSEIQN